MIFDHVGVIVPNLARGREHLANLFSLERWSEEFEDPINKVFVQFGVDHSGFCYETVAPFGEDSPVTRTLQAGDRILNHVAYLVSDLEQGAARMRSQRCMPTADAKPAIAYGGARIQFFVSPLRFIVELIEAPNHKHSFTSIFRFPA